MHRSVLVILALAGSTAVAGPVAQPGDIGLRHDVQVLADYGAIKGPTTAWPLSWDAIAADLEAAAEDKIVLPVAVQQTFDRMLSRAKKETARGDARMNARLAGAENPIRIRGFTNAPREKGELQAGFSWSGEHFSIDLVGTGAYEPLDDKEARADNSRIAFDWGNVSIAASTMDRWWGPGWDGSLILSQNARPIPALTLSRNLTHAFETKWLSWLGPWDLDVIFGQLEKERVVPDARFFGLRFTFRPVPSLEIGLSRSAQWCGEGRPCGTDTFWDMFIGKDNRGDGSITIANEPGNQLAGVDLRWRNLWFHQPSAFYAQAIAEDEAGGFPSRYMGLLGFETSGYIRNRWSYRWYAEWAGTSCDIVSSEVMYNCAYNHGIYETGYRFLGQTIGHGADNDARLVSSGIVLVSNEDTQWHLLLRNGELNRGGAPDVRNTLTPVPLDISSIDLSHARPLLAGWLDISVGYQKLEDPATGLSEDETRAWISWRSR